MRLDRALACADCGVRRLRLRRGRRDRRLGLVVGYAPGRPPRERAGELDLGERARQRVRHRLVGADPPPELLAVGDIGDAQLERAGGDADRLEGEDRERARPQRRQHVGAAERAARLAAREDAEGPALVARREDLALGAVELPDRVASDDRDVRRGVEVGDERAEGERPARVAGCDCCLIVGGQEWQERRRRPERRVEEGTARLLVENSLLEERQAGPVVLLRDRGAGPAELGQLRPRRLGVRLEEPARLGAKLVLQRCEGQVHQRDLGSPSTRSARMLRRISDVPASIVLPRLRSCCVVQ